MDIKTKLDNLIKNNIYEVSEEKPDPILIAHKYKDEYIALIAALFAYGNVKAILKFLNSLDLKNLNSNNAYYRFQTKKDVEVFLSTIKKMKNSYPLNELFLKGYTPTKNPIDGIREIIKTIYSLSNYSSKGYEFLIGKIPPNKTKGVSPYKRWNMFIRWMVRDEYPDLGLWEGVDKKDLIIPLDTHTHKVSLNLGLIKRKTYDLHSAIEITQKLKEFDPNDPIKYDFALYRIGQLNINF
ncbi:MAG: TIGR02757 family protein [Nautiliaceae bacterium]